MIHPIESTKPTKVCDVQTWLKIQDQIVEIKHLIGDQKNKCWNKEQHEAVSGERIIDGFNDKGSPILIPMFQVKVF